MKLNLPLKRSIRLTHTGFTLLEIMMVVAIIGLLAASAVYMMGDNVGVARDTKVKSDIRTLETQLMVYETQNGFAPSTAQGLKALVEQRQTLGDVNTSSSTRASTTPTATTSSLMGRTASRTPQTTSGTGPRSEPFASSSDGRRARTGAAHPQQGGLRATRQHH